MVQIALEVQGSGGFSSQLQALAAKVANLYPVLDEIGADVQASIALRFSSGTDPDGVPWLKSLRAKREGGMTLVEQGSLRQQTRSVTGDSVRIGPAGLGGSAAYAASHQFGGITIRHAQSRPVFFHQARDGTVGHRFVKKSKSNFSQWATVGTHSVTMVRRAYLGLNERDRQTIGATIARYLQGGP